MYRYPAIDTTNSYRSVGGAGGSESAGGVGGEGGGRMPMRHWVERANSPRIPLDTMMNSRPTQGIPGVVSRVVESPPSSASGTHRRMSKGHARWIGICESSRVASIIAR